MWGQHLQRPGAATVSQPSTLQDLMVASSLGLGKKWPAVLVAVVRLFVGGRSVWTFWSRHIERAVSAEAIRLVNPRCALLPRSKPWTPRMRPLTTMTRARSLGMAPGASSGRASTTALISGRRSSTIPRRSSMRW